MLIVFPTHDWIESSIHYRAVYLGTAEHEEYRGSCHQMVLLFNSEQSTTQISPIEKAKQYLFACLSVPTKTVKTHDQRALFGNKMA